MAGKELNPYTSPEAFLGAEVRLRRETRQWSQTKLAAVANMTGSRIAQIELDSVPATLDNATALDVALETGGLLARLYQLAANAPTLDNWAAAYLGMEGIASSISCYASSFIPGLLQTEGYVRAIMKEGRLRASVEEVERRVRIRLQRQEILRRAKPPSLWFLMEEELLRRPVGGTKVMAEQLGHLADLSTHPSVVIQIIPTSAGAHSAMGSTLCIADLPDRPRVAYVEGAFTGRLFTDPEDVARCTLAYDLSRTKACGLEESARLIHSAMEEMRA
ncbi:Scr1 family TA system antitoxin-like transcriptional regulator [Streptomyces sp. NPDC088725]|uniref:helix-turn-helix domain-containing protein n=1 Tax=Streptomyces sp. NPDC088725 TaxID=3365873 RepID=UPI00380ACB5C